MPFKLPPYTPPDFSRPPLNNVPTVSFSRVQQDGVAPDNYHATSIFPEYLQLHPGQWHLLRNSRMDCVIVRTAEDELRVREFRHLRVGDEIACGRREHGEDGIYIHNQAFGLPAATDDMFAFCTRLNRESSFSRDYDELYELLEFEKVRGNILWVLGPAVVFDADARSAFVALIETGYVHALLTGNALPTHDLEGTFFDTALGQPLYARTPAPGGHYHHLDTINRARAAGSLQQLLATEAINDGIVKALIDRDIPYVLAGSIRDDGPLPGVIADVYTAQDAMRALTDHATTVIAVATQLHTIATGNLTATYRADAAGQVRPVYFYTIDMSEFAATKLANRGSLTARSILTNAQDFIVTLARALTHPHER